MLSRSFLLFLFLAFPSTILSLRCYQTSGTISYSAAAPNASFGMIVDCPYGSQTCSKYLTETTVSRGCSTNVCTVNGARVNTSECIKDANKMEYCCCYNDTCNSAPSTFTAATLTQSFFLKIAAAAIFVLFFK